MNLVFGNQTVNFVSVNTGLSDEEKDNFWTDLSLLSGIP